MNTKRPHSPAIKKQGHKSLCSAINIVLPVVKTHFSNKRLLELPRSRILQPNCGYDKFGFAHILSLFRTLFKVAKLIVPYQVRLKCPILPGIWPNFRVPLIVVPCGRGG